MASRVDDACAETYNQFKIRRKHRFVVFKIDLESEAIVVEHVGTKNGTVDELKALLPYTDCRYAVFDREFKTADGRITNKLYFLSWMPHAASPYSKMAYASGKGMLREQLDGVLDATCASLDGVEAAFGMEDEKVENDDNGNPEDW